MDAMPKTAFDHPMGLYEYTRIPISLLTEPPKFMMCIDTIITESSLTETSKDYIDNLLSGGAGFYQYADK